MLSKHEIIYQRHSLEHYVNWKLEQAIFTYVETLEILLPTESTVVPVFTDADIKLVAEELKKKGLETTVVGSMEKSPRKMIIKIGK